MGWQNVMWGSDYPALRGHLRPHPGDAARVCSTASTRAPATASGSGPSRSCSRTCHRYPACAPEGLPRSSAPLRQRRSQAYARCDDLSVRWTMSDNRLGFSLIDADNHYYEAEDAFTRHGDEDVKRFVRWIQEGKRRKLVFGDEHLRHACEPHVQPDRQGGGVPPAAEGPRGREGPGRRREFARSQYGQLEPLPRRLPRPRRPPRRDGSAGRRAVLAVPDARATASRGS